MQNILKTSLLGALSLALVLGTLPVAPVAKAANPGAPYKVAIIDTGIDYDHPCLDSNVAGGKNFITGVEGKEAANDTDGHGTRVAGLIGAEMSSDCDPNVRSQNPQAQMYSLKVFETVADFYPTITPAAETNIVNAINYAANKGIKLINMSWGSYTGSEAIKNAILNHPDILFIAEAGYSQEPQLPIGVNNINQSNNNDVKPYYPASYELPNIISVTGITQRYLLFGNYGAKSVDLSAPISAPITTEAEGGYLNGPGGTYVSTALVTGAVSYYWGFNDKSNLEVKVRLLASVRKTNTMTGVVLSSGWLDLDNLLSDNFATFKIN